MDDKDQQLRIQALNCAVGHRLGNEDAKTVVENAEKYFAFLKSAPAKTE